MESVHSLFKYMMKEHNQSIWNVNDLFVRWTEGQMWVTEDSEPWPS